MAVGIGSRVSQEVLHQIAGDDGAMIRMEDFSKLDEMINIIKSATCSGMLSIKEG